MAVTEESRYEVHKYFEESMGRERATTLMELLPPVGWGDVATKQDVLLVKEDIGRLREWASETFATTSDWHEVHLELHKVMVEVHKVMVEVHKVHNSVLRELRIWATTLFMAMVALTGIAVGLD